MIKSWLTSAQIDKAYFIGLPIIWIVINWFHLPSAWNARLLDWVPLLVTTIYTLWLINDRREGNHSREHYFHLAVYFIFVFGYFMDIFNYYITDMHVMT